MSGTPTLLVIKILTVLTLHNFGAENIPYNFLTPCNTSGALIPSKKLYIYNYDPALNCTSTGGISTVTNEWPINIETSTKHICLCILRNSLKNLCWSQYADIKRATTNSICCSCWITSVTSTLRNHVLAAYNYYESLCISGINSSTYFTYLRRQDGDGLKGGGVVCVLSQ